MSGSGPRGGRLGSGEVDMWRFAPSPGCNRVSVCGILSAYAGLDPARIEFQQARHGERPILAPGLCPGLSFNLAHSGRSAVLAVAHGVRVGVDVEQVRGGA